MRVNDGRAVTPQSLNDYIEDHIMSLSLLLPLLEEGESRVSVFISRPLLS